MSKKVKDPNKMGFKEIFGVTAMSVLGSLVAMIMQTGFMVYLTDYAGIGSYAAVVGTTVLFAVRVIDAVDDPIQAFIMDKAKPTKMGKYKSFMLLAFILMAIGISCLYFIPSGITTSPVLVTIWVVFFYLVYDIGSSFNNPNLLYRTMTDDVGERSKLITFPRILTMVLSMMGTSLTAIIVKVNESVNNFHDSYGIVVCVMMLGGLIVSLLGWALIKENHPAEAEHEEEVKIKDFFVLFKENKAMTTNLLANVFSGFIWTFLFATSTYYIKWAFCADLTTGEVDMTKFGTMSLVAGMMMIMPILLATVVSVPVLKKVKDPAKMQRVLHLITAASGGVLFLLQLIGVLEKVPAIFFVSMFVSAFAIGMGFVPGNAMGMEVMDYQIWKNGKDRSALTQAGNKFLEKAQSAIASAVVGVILIAIGYQVDSVTGNYVGEVAKLPAMLNWFIVIMGAGPLVLGVATYLVYRKYPINNDVRAQMYADLEARQKAASENE